nr:type II toxin-antitoxin system RelE/ParE family toxin [uncultured Sphingomonas sp.]
MSIWRRAFRRRAGRAVCRELETCFAMLADNPQLAREREELRQRPRAFRYKAHPIFYHAQADGILILCIRNGREDWLADD